MNNTLFYNYLPSIMRQATKLTMNALLCDCQLFYKILNIFISPAIMRIVKLLLFNKLIFQTSLGVFVWNLAEGKKKVNCVVCAELPMFGGSQTSVPVGSPCSKHCMGHTSAKGDATTAKNNVRRPSGALKMKRLFPHEGLGRLGWCLICFWKYLMKAKISIQSYSVLQAYSWIRLSTIFQMSMSALMGGFIGIPSPPNKAELGPFLWPHSASASSRQRFHHVCLHRSHCPRCTTPGEDSRTDLRKLNS